MAVSDDERIPPVSFERRLPAGVTRYDLVLAVIPLSFAVALAGSLVASLPINTAVVLGASVAAVAVGDALFVNPPTQGRRGDLSG